LWVSFLHRSLQLSLFSHSCISSSILSSLHLPLTWSIHHVHVLPLVHFPLIFTFNNLGILCLAILLTCPNPSLYLVLYFRHLELSPNICVSYSIFPCFSHYSHQESHLSCCSLLSCLLICVHVPRERKVETG
jgi:hypothetical protein